MGTLSFNQKRGFKKVVNYFHHFQVDMQHIQKNLFHNVLAE